MRLDRSAVGRVIKIDSEKVVEVPHGIFSAGDVVIFFNNTNEFVCIDCKVPNSYLSAYRHRRAMIEVPPKALGNLLFIDADTVVFSGDVR